MTGPGIHRGGRRPGDRPSSGAGRAWIPAATMVLAAAGLGGWLWLGRAADRVEKTIDMERSLLAGETSGRAGKLALGEIIRTVDRMRPEELQEVQRTLDEEWQRVTDEDIEAYFAAKPEERHPILDRSIDRMLIYKELRFAVNPHAWSREGRRPRPDGVATSDAQSAAGAADDDRDARRQLRARYDDALRRRARERRIALPAWQ